MYFIVVNIQEYTKPNSIQVGWFVEQNSWFVPHTPNRQW